MKTDKQLLTEQTQPSCLGAVISRIAKLEAECEQHRYWLSNGKMSNPIKIRWRKRDLKKAQNEIHELRYKYGL